MTAHYTSFGSLPIGARFFIVVRVRDLRDRRHKVSVREHYTKTRHGSIAGFAKGPMHEDRFEHAHLVGIDADDHRLLITCTANRYAQIAGQ